MSQERTTQRIAPVGFGPAPTRGPDETWVFICHASEDRSTALQLRDFLSKSGIDSFIDVDDIHADASFVERINDALTQCTHFLALISPVSSQKKWPRHEILSVTSRVIEQSVSFLPVGLEGYGHAQFRKDFATLAHITVRPFSAEQLAEFSQQLVSDILKLSNKPALAALPEIASKPTECGLSKAAYAVAEWASKNSRRGHSWDPRLSFNELAELLKLTKDDLEDALLELKQKMYDSPASGHHSIGPKQHLFAAYDHLFMPWNPANDALAIAANLASQNMQMQTSEEVARALGFEPRRMNPAIAWLLHLGYLESKNYAVGDHDFIEYRLIPKPELRRFVKSGKA